MTRPEKTTTEKLPDLADLLEAASETGVSAEAHELVRRIFGPEAAVAAQKGWTEHLRNGGPVRTADLVRLSDVEPETVRWLWPGRIPLGKLTMLDGDPGVLKSAFSLDLSARISVGAPMPDGARPDLDGPRGTVLLSAEDGLGDTIRPRLDAAGADATKVAALRMVWDEAAEDARFPTVHDLPDIRAAIREVNAALVIIDPLVAYLGSDVNSYRDQDVRSALAGLSDLADSLGVAVLLIRHLRKSGGSNPKYAGGGSIGLIAAARAGLLIAEDPDAPEERRVLAATKMNLAPEPPALTFRAQPVDGTVSIAWEGESGHAASDLLDRPSKEERSAREEAEHFLEVELADGPRPVRELKREVETGLSFSWRTVERAKRRLGVEAVRQGGVGSEGRWVWTLLDEGRQDGWRTKGAGGMAEKGNGPEEQGSSEDGDPYPRQGSRKADLGGNDAPKFEGF